MDSQLRLIESALASGKDVYFPAQGIGTGRAALLKSAPAVYDKLDSRLQAVGIFNDPKTRSEGATSPAPEQGGLPVPPPGETPASVAPTGISEGSMAALQALEKNAPAATLEEGQTEAQFDAQNQQGKVTPEEAEQLRAKRLSSETTMPELGRDERPGADERRSKALAQDLAGAVDYEPVPTELQSALVSESLSAPRSPMAGDRIAQLLERNRVAVSPDPQNPGSWIIKDLRGGQDVAISRMGKAYVPQSAVEKIHAQNSKQAKLALKQWQESPHMIMQKAMQIWLDSIVGKWTSSSHRPVSAVNDIKNEAAANRGYKAVRRMGLHFLLNQILPDQASFWREHRESMRQAFIDAGMPEEVFDAATKQFIGGGTSQANFESGRKEITARTNRIRETIKAIMDEPGTMEGRLVLGNQNVAELVHYMLYNIFKYDQEIQSGEMQLLNPFDEEDWVRRDIVTPQQAAAMDDDEKPKAPGDARFAVEGAMDLTATSRDRMSLGNSGQRRYAVDAAAPDDIGADWLAVDEEGLDLPIFQNMNHPERNEATGYFPGKASIGFQISTDPTANVINPDPETKRSSTLEIRTAKAVQQLLMLEPGMDEMLIQRDDKTMVVGKDIPYTRDKFKVVEHAVALRRRLNTGRIVLVAWPKGKYAGQTEVVGERSRYTKESEKIFALREGDPDIEILRKNGASTSVPFSLGEQVKYPAGIVRPGQLDTFIVDVDPVVHQAVRHTIPLTKTGGGRFQVAYIPEPFRKEAEAKGAITEVVAEQGPGASTRMKIPGIRTLAVGVDQLPIEGARVDGYTYGDPFVDNPELYAETTDRERENYKLSVEKTRGLEEAVEAGTPSRDLPDVSEKTQSDAQMAVSRFEGFAAEKPGIVPAIGQERLGSGADRVLGIMNLGYLPDPRMVPEAYSIALQILADGTLEPDSFLGTSFLGTVSESQAASDSKLPNVKKLKIRYLMRNLVGMGEKVLDPKAVEKWLQTQEGQDVVAKLRASLQGEGQEEFIREFGLDGITFQENGTRRLNPESPKYTGWARTTDYDAYDVYDMFQDPEDVRVTATATVEDVGDATTTGERVYTFSDYGADIIEKPPLSDKHQAMVNTLLEDLMVVLRHRAMWSNFSANGGLNENPQVILETKPDLEDLFVRLQKRGLWGDAVDAALIRELPSTLLGSMPIEKSTVVEIVTSLPPDVKVSSGGARGIYGIDKYLDYESDGTPESRIVDEVYRAFVDMDTAEESRVRLVPPVEREVAVDDTGENLPDQGPEGDIADTRQADPGMAKYEFAIKKKFRGDSDMVVLGREIMSEIGSGAAKNFEEAAKIVQSMEAPEDYSGKTPWNSFVSQNYPSVQAAVTDFARRGTGRKIVSISKAEEIGTKANVSRAISKMIKEVDPSRWDTVLNRVFEKWSITLARDTDGKSPMKAVNAGLYRDQFEVDLDEFMNKNHSITVTNAIIGNGAVLPEPVVFKGKRIEGGHRPMTYLEVQKLVSDSFAKSPNRERYASDVIRYAKARNFTFVYTSHNGKPVIVLARVNNADNQSVMEPLEIVADDSEYQTQVFTPDEMNRAVEQFGGSGIVQFKPLEGEDPDSPLFTLELADVTKQHISNVESQSPNTKAQTSIRRLLDASLLIRFRKIVNETLEKNGMPPKYTGADLDLVKVESTMDGMNLFGPFGSRYIPSLLGGVTRARRREGSLTLEGAARLAEAQDQTAPGVDPILDEARRLGKAPEYAPLDPATYSMSKRLGSALKNNRLKLIGGGGTALGSILAGTIVGAGVDTAVTGAQYGDKVASSNLPVSVALNALGEISPTAGAALMLGTGALTQQDMLRLAINMIAGFAGGAAGGALGSFAGPVGTFAGATAGSTGASVLADSVYGAISGNPGSDQRFVPPNVAVDSGQLGGASSNAAAASAISENTEEDPLKAMTRLGMGG
jgi:hypothetical protein